MDVDDEDAVQMGICCECAAQTPSNATNMCVDCLRNKIDITDGISRQVGQSHCRGCNRYERMGGWVACEMESKELLAILLKRIRGLDKVHLVDASFVWTEAHSKRMRVKLTVQREVVNGAVLQATLVVEFVISNRQCEKCARVEAKDYWVSCVQVRQKVEHKRTMFWLEQLILKHNAHADSTSIAEMRDGLDFFHGEKNHSEKLLSFLQTVAPLRYKTARQMITQDQHTGHCRNKFTFSVEIVPICKDDLCCLPADTAHHLSNVHPLVLCHKVGANMHFTDPRTLQIVELQPYAFFKRPFVALCTRAHMRDFVVLDVVPVVQPHTAAAGKDGGGAPSGGGMRKRRSSGAKASGRRHESEDEKKGPGSSAPLQQQQSTLGSKGSRRAANPLKLQLAEITVARLSDLGKNDTTFVVLSHLGGLLKAGDHAKGYDLNAITVEATDFPALKGRESEVPDIVLVRKAYANTKRKRRFWRLKCLRKEIDETLTAMDQERARNDYDHFLQDLEEDRDMRAEINLYRDPDAIAEQQRRDAELALKIAAAQGPTDGADADEDEDGLSEAEVGLEELLDDLTLADNETFDDKTPLSAFAMPGAGGPTPPTFHFV